MEGSHNEVAGQGSTDSGYAIELMVDHDRDPRSNGLSTTDEESLLSGKGSSDKAAGCPRLLTIALVVCILLLLLICSLLAVALLVNPSSVASPGTAPVGTVSIMTTEDLSHAACNNNGILYSGSTSCDCFPCYRGESCLELDHNCTMNLSSGDPLVMEAYWVEHSSEALTVTMPSFRIGYANNGHLPELEAVVRKLHAKVGNANTEGCQIVFGVGSTQLIGAAWFALANATGSNPALVWGKAPFYSGYRTAEMFESRRFAFLDSNDPPSPAPQQQVIEMVTSPNNPDGRMRSSVVSGASVVYDNAYYWPHFAPITKAEETTGGDVRLFTLSKLSGHAGTRIGWAIVRDADIAERMRGAVNMMTLGVPFESQEGLAAVVLQAIVDREDGGTLSYGRQKMSGRWERLQAALAGSKRFRLQPLEDEAFCNFHREVKAPSPAYVWMECLLEEDVKRSCWQTFIDIGIQGQPGKAYGGSDAFVRIELLCRDSTFDLAMEKITA
eukprot:CAMPEP_0117648714 /NCGR_PEP_ID=MMETSP0804-20121206/564_1 /TAXON_ID=1074897 /ORGANISM="Tetraselmis astigmatica, Strain CCMP880" /LENGTH=497 /DNA_ID=CAMNT_0005454359 /DNA_START=66 /DNA_END=1556 /DNA_ORIENTATION=+